MGLKWKPDSNDAITILVHAQISSSTAKLTKNKLQARIANIKRKILGSSLCSSITKAELVTSKLNPKLQPMKAFLTLNLIQSPFKSDDPKIAPNYTLMMPNT